MKNILILFCAVAALNSCARSPARTGKKQSEKADAASVFDEGTDASDVHHGTDTSLANRKENDPIAKAQCHFWFAKRGLCAMASRPLESRSIYLSKTTRNSSPFDHAKKTPYVFGLQFFELNADGTATKGPALDADTLDKKFSVHDQTDGAPGVKFYSFMCDGEMQHGGGSKPKLSWTASHKTVLAENVGFSMEGEWQLVLSLDPNASAKASCSEAGVDALTDTLAIYRVEVK